LRQLHRHPGGTLDRPGPHRPSLGQPEHLPEPCAVAADLQRRELGLPAIDHRHRVATLGRVDHDHHRSHLASIRQWGRRIAEPVGLFVIHTNHGSSNGTGGSMAARQTAMLAVTKGNADERRFCRSDDRFAR
jgi:hypothetical protein